MIELTLDELTQAVRKWCEDHDVVPANGQAAEEISERTIRYYRTLGLMDAPIGGYQKRFLEKHRLQLIAIRILQAQGLPLRRIRDELYGQSQEDLAAFEQRFSSSTKKSQPLGAPFQPAVRSENWSVLNLAGDFMLISRMNRTVPRAIIEKINDLLQPLAAETETIPDTSRN